MKLITVGELSRCEGEFDVLTKGPNIQVASMVLQPGTSSGEYGNEHPESDQALYVIDGQGEATVGGEEVKIATGDTLLIEAGAPHQIRCTGERALRTLDFYAPPAY